MRDPGLFARLFARPGADPHADGNAAHVRHALGDHADPVAEHGALDIAYFVRAPAAAGHGCLHPYCTALHECYTEIVRQPIVGMELADIQAALGALPDAPPAFR